MSSQPPLPPPPPLPVRVCPRHGLVAGTDGRCVLCQRARPGDAGSTRGVAGAVLAALALFGGVLVWKGMRGKAPPVREEVASELPPTPPPPPQPVEELVPPTPEDEAKERRRRKDEQERQRNIEAEMHRVLVRMFMAKDCDLCDVARKWLKDNGMTYTEIDVEADPANLAAMLKLTPLKQVPVFEVDGEVLVGFGPTNVAGAVRRAADRRAR